MKITKTIILFSTISLFTLITYSAANAAVDCSNPKGFHAKMTCKLKGISPSESSVSTDEPKKKGNSIWKTIKNFGGKKVGEPG